MAVLVKSERGSLVLVKAKKKKKSKQANSKYHEMFQHVFGQKEATAKTGIEGLYANIADANRKGAIEGASSEGTRGRTLFHIGKKPKGGFKSATTGDLDAIISMDAHMQRALTTGDWRTVERMVAQGQLTDKLLSLMQNSPAVQEKVSLFADHAAGALEDREGKSVRQGKKWQGGRRVIDPETRTSQKVPRTERTGSTERPMLPNKDYLPEIDENRDSSATDVLFGGGGTGTGDPLTDSVDSMREPGMPTPEELAELRANNAGESHASWCSGGCNGKCGGPEE